MDVLWAKNGATVSDVVAALPPPPLAYNTVLSTLRTLEQKGYVCHEETGARAFRYVPLVQRRDAAKSAVNHVIERFFKTPNALAVALLDDVAMSETNRKRIRDLIERSKKGSK